MLQILILAGPIVLFGGWFLWALYSVFFSSLANVPGPFLCRITDLWYFSRIYNGSFEKENLELHKKYGPVVRYGPNRYSISDPHATQIIYSPSSKFIKSNWYDAWIQPMGAQWDLFSDRDPHRHRLNRRQYQNMYSMSSLVDYEPYVDACSDIFSQRMLEMSTEGGNGAVDMGHWFRCYAIDVISMITFSKRLGFLDFGEDIGGLLQQIETVMGFGSMLGVYSHFRPLLVKISKLLEGKKGKQQMLIQFTHDCIAEHEPELQAKRKQENFNGPTDFTTKFVNRQAENPAEFTSYHTEIGCLSNIAAGSDTTFISLSGTLYHILRNPEVVTKLRQEVDDICPSVEGASPHISFNQTQKMPYLQAVLKEALRMHPATGLPLERVVPPGGATISNVFFPEGTTVGVNTWVEHRSKAIFGKDADDFNPDRWLDSDKDRVSVMNRHWMPFGLGSRTCIGRHISMLEMTKLIPRLIRDFDMKLAIDGQWETSNHWFVKPVNFKVLVKQRKDA